MKEKMRETYFYLIVLSGTAAPGKSSHLRPQRIFTHNFNTDEEQ